MSTERPSEVLELEEQALERLDSRGEDELEEGAVAEPEAEEFPVPSVRLAFVVGFSVLAAAIMAGGIFKGISPRFWAAIAGVLGIALAIPVNRMRNAIAVNLSIAFGILAVGVIITAPAGSFGDVINLGPFVREAVTSGDIIRPPADFTLGWRAIVGWLMGGLGFSAAWIAIQLRRPAIGLLAPMPIVAIGAISVADEAKLVSGLLALFFFAVGLGLLSGVELGEGEQRSLGYELRRGARAIPMIAIITVALYFAAQTNFLFPKPVFDPTQEAQRPKTVPITEVPDRVLFTVRSSVTGVWRMGGLDVYENSEWLLPPFADNRLEEVPRSGIVDSELSPGVKATFEIKDLGGAVLPGLSNLVGLVAEGPKLAYDSRTGNIRLAEGTIQEGLAYTVTAARLPLVEELRNISGPPPKELEQFLEIPPPPPGVADLLSRAPAAPLWDRLEFARQELLRVVVAEGAGTPVPVPPSKVQDMLVGSKTGTPFEIVAGQAMLARWAGVPSRIGYGFDGGEKVGDRLEIRPRHGASFMEVYFPGHKWLPVIGTPRQAKSSVGSQFTQQNRDVLASDDIAVNVFVPYEVDPRTFLFEQIRRAILLALPFIAAILLAYFSWPAIRKSIARARRRSWARRRGPRERIAIAYAEFRDLATDLGYRHHADTPLMFLGRAIPDEEHAELGWLVTRALWGDLQGELSEDDALAAEELSKSLKRRMTQAHPWTLRAVATISRLSIKHPYAPLLGAPERKERRPVAKAA